MCPCRAFYDWGFYFFFIASYLGVVFLEYLGLKGSQISSEKKQKTKKSIRQQLGKDAMNTWSKIQGLSLENGVDIWTLVR